MLHGRKAAAVALGMLFSSSLLPAQAAPGMEDIEAVTNNLVLKELQFFKLNANLKRNSLPHSRWAARRWAAVGIANNTLTSIGAFETAYGRFHWLDNPKKAPADFFEHAAWCRFIANAITVGGATAELASDRWSAWKEHKNGTDLGTTRKYVEGLKQEIDTLVEKRQAAVEALSCTAEERKVLQDEGLVLEDMRQLAANEFARFYAEAKSNRIARNVGLIVSWVSNFESGAGSFYGGIHASQVRRVSGKTRARMGGVGGVTDIISGSINVAGPFVVRGVGMLARAAARNSVAKQLDCEQTTQLANLEEHQRALAADTADHPTLSVKAVLLRQKACATEAKILSQHEELRNAEAKASRARFIESVVNNGISGGTKIANGVGGAVGAFKYTNQPRPRFAWSGGVSIAYGAGNAFSGAETLRNLLWDELRAHDSKEKHKSTGQVLSKQIEDLEQVEATIRNASDGVKFAENMNMVTQ